MVLRKKILKSHYSAKIHQSLEEWHVIRLRKRYLHFTLDCLVLCLDENGKVLAKNFICYPCISLIQYHVPTKTDICSLVVLQKMTCKSRSCIFTFLLGSLEKGHAWPFNILNFTRLRPSAKDALCHVWLKSWFSDYKHN